MILEIQNGAHAKGTTTPPIEFVTMQLMQLRDGSIGVSMKSTIFDEEELELIDQDIADERVVSLDQLFELVRSHVQITPEHQTAARISSDE